MGEPRERRKCERSSSGETLSVERRPRARRGGHARCLVAAALAAPPLAAGACIDWGSLSPPTTGALADAGPDVLDAGEGGGGCHARIPNPFFCDDFDHGGLGTGWDQSVVSAGAALGLVPAVRSPPNAMSAHTLNVGVAQGWAYLRKDLGAAASEVTLAFDMSLESLGGAYADFGGIYIDRGGGRFYALAIRVNSMGAYSLVELDTDDAGTTQVVQETSFRKSAPPPGWFRLALAVKLGAGSARVLLDDDPTPVVDMTLTPTATSGTRQAIAGMKYFTVDGWSALIDNVSVDVDVR